jgi:GNAT superfamily N-acetyltransferase
MQFNASHISIQPFQRADQNEVKDLILAGLGEHWGSIDSKRNPDLDDIITSYTGAVFLVAHLDGQLAGSGALMPRSQTKAEIVRMSVARNFRRQGIGRLILKHLLEHARKVGFKEIVLETTATWQEAIQFYKDNGFQVTHFQDGDIFFRLLLPKQMEPIQFDDQVILEV